MINGLSNRKAVLELLSDHKPHFSAEFRDKLNLLEYRKRLSELREEGHIIESLRIGKRPAYILIKHEKQLELFG